MHCLVSLLAFLIAFTGTARGVSGLNDRAKLRPGLQRLNTATQIADRLEKVTVRGHRGRRKEIFMLGDSTLGQSEGAFTLPALLRRKLISQAGSSTRLDLRTYSGPGLGPRAFYFLADKIKAAKPDLILWEISFTHFSQHWNRASIEEFSGWLELGAFPDQLPTALSFSKVTIDKLLFYRALVLADKLEHWRQLLNEMSRTGKLLDPLAGWADGLVQSTAQKSFHFAAARAQRNENRLPGKRDRLNLNGAREIFGAALNPLDADHPSLLLIAATLRRYRERGIPVIVYLNPINVDNLWSIDASTPGVLRANAELLKRTVEVSGATFLDYHDFLGDENFDDAAGHFKTKKMPGIKLLAEKLSTAVLQTLKRNANQN